MKHSQQFRLDCIFNVRQVVFFHALKLLNFPAFLLHCRDMLLYFGCNVFHLPHPALQRCQSVALERALRPGLAQIGARGGRVPLQVVPFRLQVLHAGLQGGLLQHQCVYLSARRLQFVHVIPMDKVTLGIVQLFHVNRLQKRLCVLPGVSFQPPAQQGHGIARNRFYRIELVNDFIVVVLTLLQAALPLVDFRVRFTFWCHF